MVSLVLVATLFGLFKSVLVALLAVLNAVLAAFAVLAVWKAYLAIGIKVAFIVLLCIPVVGIVIYFLWGRKKVEAAS